MSIEIKAGTLIDFLESAKQTAREIDAGGALTPKNTIWVEAADMARLLKPQRTALIKYLRKHKRVIFSDLSRTLKRSPVSLNNDLDILSKYALIRITREPNSGHGIHKVIESSLGDETVEFSVKI